MSFPRCFSLVSDVTYVLEAASGIQKAGSPSLWAQAVRKLRLLCFVCLEKLQGKTKCLERQENTTVTK